MLLMLPLCTGTVVVAKVATCDGIDSRSKYGWIIHKRTRIGVLRTILDKWGDLHPPTSIKMDNATTSGMTGNT